MRVRELHELLTDLEIAENRLCALERDLKKLDPDYDYKAFRAVRLALDSAESLLGCLGVTVLEDEE